jgi:hypothetical protein
VAVVAKQEAWGSTFRVEGLVIIDANEPDRPPKILRENFAIAEGLDFNPLIGAWGSAGAKGYYGIDTAISIGDTYPVITPEGKWAMAATSYTVDWRGVRRYNGVYLLDKMGNIIERYEKDIPDWLIQPFDEDSFLEGGINAWGNHKRGESFDLFAPGFLWIAPSPERITMSEDTRYVYDPDTNQIVALTLVHFQREKGELSLAGVFKTTSKGIFYYDLSKYNLMSGKSASGIVQSKITARAGTRYFTAMELLYPVKISNDTKYAWFVPIYFESEAPRMIGLAGLGIVDAQSPEKVIIEYTGEGITGESLIKKTKQDFKALYGEVKPLPEFKTIEGKLIAKYEPYVSNGNTRQWLTIETVDGKRIDVLVKAELLSDAELLAIQKLQVGDQVRVEVDEFNVVRKVP